jgi:hypothetical protein
VPLDIIVKPLLLFFHYLGFSIIVGSFYFNTEPRLSYSLMVIVSGILLIVREIYEEGLIWLFKTEGLLTIFKLLLLLTAILLRTFTFSFLMVAIFLGAATSHLPKGIKKTVWLKV